MHVVKVSLGDRSYDIEIGTRLDQIGGQLQGLGLDAIAIRLVQQLRQHGA